MKIFGIICEYDPLHNGHVRLINYAKSFADSNTLIACIMSGNFVQRGLPSILNKFCRAKHAILSGADVVIELPTIFSTSSAPDFALGGVAILNKLNADTLFCGTECPDRESILTLAEQLTTPSPIFDNVVQNYLKAGNNYPTAIAMAEKEVFNTVLLNTPNNLLAVEYAKAIFTTNSKLKLQTLKRDSNFFDESNLQNCSSSVIRNAFLQNNLSKVCNHLPNYVFDDLLNAKKDYLQKYQNFIPLFLSTLSKEQLANIADVAEGLNNSLLSNLETNFDEYLNKLKTKRYTRARLNRIFLYSILNVTKQDQNLKTTKEIPLNILAIKNNPKIIATIKNLVDANNANASTDFLKIKAITDKSDLFYNTMFSVVINKNDVNKLNKF